MTYPKVFKTFHFLLKAMSVKAIKIQLKMIEHFSFNQLFFLIPFMIFNK